MPMITQIMNGKVSGLWGKAMIRSADGQLRKLQLGDLVVQGDMLLTTQDGIIQLVPVSSGDEHVEIELPPFSIDTRAPILVAATEIGSIIEGLNKDEPDLAPAAGLTGADGGLAESLRVDRIVELVQPGALTRTVSADPAAAATFQAGTALEQLGVAAPTAIASRTISAVEEGPSVALGIPAPAPTGPGMSVRIDQVPAVGQVQTASGTVLLAGSVIASGDLPGLIYVPPTDYGGGGAGQLIYTVTSPQGSTSGSLIVALTPTNDAPLASASAVTGLEDGVLPVSLGGQDVDGAIAGVTITGVPASGALFLADGVTPVLAGQTLTAAQAAQLLYMPSSNFFGNGSFTFTVTDDGGAVSAPSTVQIVVLSVNDAPVLASETITTANNAPLAGNVLSNDSDVEGSPITVTQFSIQGSVYAPGSVASVAGIGTLQINVDGTYLFTPQTGYNGPVPTATYTVSDSSATSNATLNVSVTATNDAPVAMADSAFVAEDSAIVINVLSNDTDANGDTLRVVSVAGQPISMGQPAAVPGGTVSLNTDGSLTFAPSPNFNGAVNFSYVVSDGVNWSVSSVSIDVGAVNDAPVANLDATSTALGTPVSIAVLANDTDVDGDALTLTAAALADPAQGSVALGLNGSLVFTPAAGFSGNATITYQVSDPSGATANGSVTVAVLSNSAPTGTSSSIAILEDASTHFTSADFGFADGDAGQTFANLRIDSLPAFGALTYGGLLVAAGQIIPVADLANLVYTPGLNENGTAYSQFGFSVQDNLGGFDAVTRQLTFDVTAVPDTAALGTGSGAVTEDGALTTGGTLTVSDADAGQAGFTAQAATAGSFGSFALNAAGAWTYTLNNAAPAVQALGAGQTLSETFSVSALDGTTSSVTVTINGSNDAAVISGATATLKEDAGVSAGNLVAGGVLSVADADSGQSAFIAQSSTAGTYGTFSINAAGAWSYSAPNANIAIQALAAGQVVTESFTVRSVDGTASTVVVNINGANDAPVANGNSVGTNEDAALTIASASLLANDTDVDTGALLSISSVQGAVGGTVALNGSGNVVFTPTANFSGNASFTYTVVDGNGGSSTATVNVAVASVADAPSLVAPTSLFSLNAGSATISTEPGIAQVTLESTLGLTTGQLDTMAPPAGSATNDPGNVDIVDGKQTSYTLDLGSGNRANFSWQFFNGEDQVGEINSGYNDVVALAVTDPAGVRQLIQISSSEQVGPNTNGAAVDASGLYQFTATTAGTYSFSWMVLNARDGNKDSSITVDTPTITIGANTYGAPISFPVSGALTDTDGSESLSFTVTGVPAGAGFTAGQNLGGGTWSVTSAELSGLSFLPATGFSGTVNLTLNATATEAGNPLTASASQTIAVTVESTTVSTMGTQAADTLNGAATNDQLKGFDGNDVLSGADGNDLLYGDAGNDSLDGGNGLDVLYGGAGNDTLSAGAGNDRLYGGAGNDALTGGAGVDVFAWTLADRGSSGTPAVDTITDFNVAAPAAGGDLLDLRDLLQGEAKAGLSAGTLDKFLDFDTTSSAGNTIIRISSSGGFTGGTYSAGAEDQRIILQGVDLRSAGAFGLNASATDNDIIQQLLQRGKLVTDGP